MNNIAKKILTLGLALSALGIFSVAKPKTGRTVEQIKKSKTIKIAVFSDKKPFGFVDENGEYQGYDVYFGNRIAKDLGVKVKYVPVEAAARVEVLATGKVDIVLANFTVTPER
ncbi:MAG: transporter substrate-binding domain-containing protein, partial [Treponema sp.]|nr:transporter substrate-binding domain-containing protein [Treponema sp.]